MLKQIYSPSPLRIPDEFSERREPARPQEFRDEGFELAFDFSTLIYDAFCVGHTSVAIGPPLLNLNSFVDGLTFRIGGLQQRCCVRDLHCVSRWRFESRWSVPRPQAYWPVLRNSVPPRPGPRGDLEVGFDRGTPAKVTIGRNLCELFAGKRCLLTKSKDNDLQWISDWVDHHVRKHGANALLLYDNASTRYDAREILNAVARIDGLDVAVVVNWPFKWGPTGHRTGKWDSDFAQYGILEHARWRLLSLASAVVYLDVDELVIGDGSVFALAESSSTGAVAFAGRWIENVMADPGLLKGARPRHRHFKFFDPATKPAEQKWCAVPARSKRSKQWKVHHVDPMTRTEAFLHRHFRGISSGWKYDRSVQPYDPEAHIVDERLVRELTESTERRRPEILTNAGMSEAQNS